MNNETKLNGALCADRGAADAMQAAPAEGKRKYVPPRMQVIPLSPQRMLATSGVSGPPVKVALTLHAVDYYFSDNCGNSFEKSGSLDRVGCASFVNGTFDADWTAIKAGYPGLISAWQADPEHGNVGGSCHGCALTSTAPA